ncbi:hypothetical protein [Lysinibacillus sp. OF-1]|uniref:hypothetical protein n=1 Tax=Lysinibacillus sp. OF-1 TaxID=2972483 RepID=UPI00232FBFD0|nr:hypothetical protein [Lysinibacillus sp. OF-1]WCH46414.1 hypothetical protein NV349_15105 [Lysinibacillus sp. OF-1]
MKAVEKTQLEKIKKALEKYGIFNEEQLNEAIKNMKPLNIGCMVSPVPSKKVLEEQEC